MAAFSTISEQRMSYSVAYATDISDKHLYVTSACILLMEMFLYGLVNVHRIFEDFYFRFSFSLSFFIVSYVWNGIYVLMFMDRPVY